MRRFTGAMYAGAVVFVAGAVMLAFAIDSLMPHGSGTAYTGDMFSKFIIDIGMLLVATFMVAMGMFFVTYGGERKGTHHGDEEEHG